MRSAQDPGGRRGEALPPEQVGEGPASTVRELVRDLPGYEILRDLGKGSMGVVFEARRHADGRKVALKVLPPSLDLTPRAVSRFLRESELVAQVRHEGIVPVLEAGRWGRVHYFVMAFVEGTPLDQRVRAGPLPVREAAQVAVQAARALHAAHARGIVHRDIKPANLIQRPDGGIVVTDFGLARDAGSGSVTEAGAMVGTPMYMAPEQAVGERAMVGTRTDVYALGATLYELLTGQPPFAGPSTLAVLRDVMERPPLRPRRLRHDLPPSLEAIVQKAMEKQPSRRYGSALEMGEDLERYLEGRPVQARRPLPGHAMVRLAVRRPLACAGVLVLLLLLSAVAILGAQGQRHDREARERRVESLLALAHTVRGDGDAPRTAEERRSFLEQAMAEADLLVAAHVRHPEAWLLRARAQHRLGRHVQALADYDRYQALKGGPTVDLLHRRLDTLLHVEDPDRWQRLWRDLQDLVALDQGELTRLVAADAFVRVASLLRRGVANGADSGTAAPWLDQAEALYASLGPTSARALAGLAAVDEMRGMVPQAQDRMLQARALAMGDPAVLARAAAFFLRHGRLDLAHESESMARMVDPAAFPASTGGEPPHHEAEEPVDLEKVTTFFRQAEELLDALTRAALGGESEDPSPLQRQ